MLSIGLKAVSDYGYVVIISDKEEGTWRELRRGEIMTFEHATSEVVRLRAFFGIYE